MAKDAAPKCPKCGGCDSKPLSTKDGYLHDPPDDGEQPVATATVYLCPCGETFSHVVTHLSGRKK
jgi:hypothetical protein